MAEKQKAKILSCVVKGKRVIGFFSNGKSRDLKSAEVAKHYEDTHKDNGAVSK